MGLEREWPGFFPRVGLSPVDHPGPLICQSELRRPYGSNQRFTSRLAKGLLTKGADFSRGSDLAGRSIGTGVPLLDPGWAGAAGSAALAGSAAVPSSPFGFLARLLRGSGLIM